MPRATGRVPGAVDVRLVPALVLTLATCLGVPTLPYEVALVLPWVLLVAAVVVTVLLVVAGHARRTGLMAVAALVACALWIAAVAGVQAVSDRVPVKVSGWEDVVAGGQAVRLSGEATGRAVRSPGAFGDSWHLAVDVDRFGHPLRPVPRGAEVVVSGGEEWDGVEAGTRVCLTASLEREGTSVFARARTGPDAGPCPPGVVVTGEGGGRVEPTGREVVRSAVRDAAVGSVGAAPQLLPGLVLGDRSLQEPALDEAMKAAGLSHLSAVSGDNFVKGYRSTAVPTPSPTQAGRSVKEERNASRGSCLLGGWDLAAAFVDSNMLNLRGTHEVRPSLPAPTASPARGPQSCPPGSPESS